MTFEFELNLPDWTIAQKCYCQALKCVKCIYIIFFKLLFSHFFFRYDETMKDENVQLFKGIQPLTKENNSVS